MSADATYEEGAERPLNLGAMDGDDLAVLSALAQDAVVPASEMAWRAGERRFAMLVNRFRWEDPGSRRHGPERVQSVLSFENVRRVASQGIAPGEADTVLSLLSIAFEPQEAPGGHVVLTFAGDGALRLEVEACEARLRDVTRPYRAPSGRAPRHED